MSRKNRDFFQRKVGIFKRHLFMFIDLVRRGLLIAYKYPNSDRPILIFIIISIPLHMSKKI